MSRQRLGRRQFVKSAVGAGVTVGAMGPTVFAQDAVRGANDRINVAMIGTGGRGMSVMRWVMETGGQTEPMYRGFGPPPPAPDPALAARVVAVCDVYEKRKRAAQKLAECEGTLDWREVLDRKDVDAVIIATPDHWHARQAIDALKKGKDVYLEKPVTHTIDEARKVAEVVKQTGRVLQVGSQTTSSDQWWQARKAIQEGMIGDYVDWKMWLGDAPSRPWDADRFFRFRKYWDYSGGIATDLFYHVMAPLNIAWGEAQFPHKVMASGGIYAFHDREVPDTFALMAEYPKGHSLVLSSSMANDTHIPGLLRGREGTIMMVPEGRFEGRVDHITVTPQPIARQKFKERYRTIQVQLETEPRESHMANFLRSVKTRQKPVLDADTAYAAMVTIGMSVQSYREGRVLYFDAERHKVTSDPMPATL